MDSDYLSLLAASESYTSRLGIYTSQSQRKMFVLPSVEPSSSAGTTWPQRPFHYTYSQQHSGPSFSLALNRS